MRSRPLFKPATSIHWCVPFGQPYLFTHPAQGEDLSLDSLFKTRKGLPRHLMDHSKEAEKPGWGPEVGC